MGKFYAEMENDMHPMAGSGKQRWEMAGKDVYR
jgi:hypothetical protein